MSKEMRDLIESFKKSINESMINKALFHGTYSNGLTELKPHTNNYGSIPPSIFLSSKKQVAKDYGPIIYKCKIDCNNIEEYDVNGNSFHEYTDFERNITDSYNSGHDCVIFRNIMDSKEPNTKVPISDIYVVFDTKNVIILEEL